MISNLSLIAILTTILAVSVQAKVLIIPKKGPTIWAKSTKESGSTLSYISDKGTKTMPTADVAFTISAVERGRTYTSADIDAMIAKVAAAKRRHPNLRKQLDPLADEWSALKRGDAKGLAGDIAQIETAFNPETASFTDLKNAKSKLAMLKYRDLQKQHGGKIDQVSQTLTNAYLTRASARLQAMTTHNPKLHAHVQAVAQLADDIQNAAPTDPRAKKAASIKDAEIAAAEKAIIADAAKAFNRGRTLDGYLAARARLRAWQRLLPDGDARKATAEKHLGSLVNALKKTQPAYDFRNRGFPFTRADYTILKTTINNSTSLKPADATEDIAFLFPPKPLPPLNTAKNPPFQLRAIFNETPPSRGEWALRIQPLDGTPPTIIPTRLPPLQKAATTLSFTVDLSPYANTITPPSGNKPNTVGQLVHRPTPDADWSPKSWYLGILVR